jgi:transposase|tara:strand:+ start:201 stop:1847 length:1647 start_codon:yes stop_codon:yes gene_type:complete
MYVDEATSQGKYKRYLLRESYRENGKVKHRTIANISSCSPEEIQAIRLALRHKNNLADLVSIDESISLHQGLSVGAVWLLHDVARQLGITGALGCSRDGKLALWQVIARVIDQGSRLSAVRLAGYHAACDILALEAFDEDDLYANLDWLCENQARIENRLFKVAAAPKKPGLYLYDVTSSYLEGVCNELGAFGYNRDGKKGKRQIVIGLLCNEKGRALSIEVFAGNTSDPATMASQVRKVAERFGGGAITFVGDRGMLKSAQIEDLVSRGFHYITAITKPQIEALLSAGTFQPALFDQELAEIEADDGVRYILRRNPLRAEEVRASRRDKLQSLRREVRKQNEYLTLHTLARVDVALRKINERRVKLKIDKWVTVSASERSLSLDMDDQALAEVEELDGCYVLKTDLGKGLADKETVHARYKDLALVERAFRTSKTVELEMRPIHVRLATRTRGHALVVMLGYVIVQELSRRWCEINLTVEEGIKQLTTLCATELHVNGQPRCNRIPEPRESIQELLATAEVRLPDALACKGIKVATRKKLPENRIKS